MVLAVVAKIIYDTNINYNFKEITKDKVYKSGTIPPEKLPGYIEKHHIKSVIDLRFPESEDEVHNPEVPEELIAEKEVLDQMPGVNYFHIGSEQIPDQETLDKFFEVMDNPENYPVLIHCYHGEGRAILFSTIYRMEYENMPNEEARKKSRVVVKWGNFDHGTPKGEYVKKYLKRRT